MTAPLRFSIVVPTHDRLPALRRALAAIDRLVYDPERFEVIVVDDGSGDGTAGYLAGRTDRRFQGVSQPRAGVAAARNTAIRRARGEIVAFTDDDCEVPPDWLTAFDAQFRASGADVIGGSVENALPDFISQFYQDMATHLYEKQNEGAAHPEFLSANNLAIRRDALARGGLFDDRFFLGGEDRELVKRLALTGARVVYRPELKISHYHAFNLASYARHLYRMGRGSYLLHRVVPRERRYAAVRPDPRVHRAFLGRLLGAPPAWQAPARVALFALAQASVLTGFLAAALAGTRQPAGAPRRGPSAGGIHLPTPASTAEGVHDAIRPREGAHPEAPAPGPR